MNNVTSTALTTSSMLSGDTNTPSYPLQLTMSDQELSTGYVTPILEFGLVENGKIVAVSEVVATTRAATTDKPASDSESLDELLAEARLEVSEWGIQLFWIIIIAIVLIIIYKHFKHKQAVS